ncbi:MULTISPECIES: outer membrane lipoprotein-sorting protein [unclassified Leisingera]|uniref:outer membrane lipoprotein-sorting protein n=1 Tax=unclassified Leisingera TaxID=2614906 RepID=UPI001012DBAB|nr:MULTISPECIES: outer membrane lipoprotein-sorting protein [unclassified Leisingera]MBQ4825846.1 outer membrane lipoprotein-sorting protein [Leisingera sp. HS039]QAX32198.1 outer membrane lipoprotein-sorting protein [Leisingera sp. NJS204]
MPDSISRLPRRGFLALGGGSLATAMLAPGLVLAAPDALEVATAVNNIELTGSMAAMAKVELRRTGAPVRTRDLEVSTARQGGKDLSDRRYVFLAPADVRDTKLLVHEQGRKDNDLWLMLPSLGKVRRISASKQANAFAGTDFSYANLMAMRLENFTHAITAGSGSSITLESTVRSAGYGRSIGYARAVTQARAGSMVPFQIDYFDQKGRHLKTQKMSKAAQAPDGKHILRSRHMIVHGKGRETLISLSKIDFSPNFGGGHFRSQSL